MALKLGSPNFNYEFFKKPGQQFLDGLYKNLVVYEDFNDNTQKYSVHLYNIKTGHDSLITPGPNSYGSGGTNGKYVVYIDGGVCGKLMLYNIMSKVTSPLAEGVCIPKISGHWVIWHGNGAAGPGIYGYDLSTKQYFEVSVGDGPYDTSSINNNKVVWMTPTGSRYRIMLKDLVSNSVRTLLDTTNYYVNYPAVSRQFVVWGKSISPGVAGVEGIDLKTSQLFEIYPQGPHQNTNLAPAIWGHTAVWQAWRTGNGDIYGATLTAGNSK